MKTIILINKGIAYRIGDTIHINSVIATDKYKELFNYCLNHELEHSNNENFNIKDLLLDVKLKDYKTYKEMLRFCIRNPEQYFYNSFPIGIHYIGDED